jgi:FkbM family methyltransferase
MKITYGIIDNNIDVTDICKRLAKQNIIKIPRGEHYRAARFTDPLYGTLKSIFITSDDGAVVEYDASKIIYIDLNTTSVFTNDDTIPEYISAIYPNFEEKLKNIHSNLKIQHGSFNDEYPEQLMVARYLTGNEKVLEIGANIGRNTLVISYILSQQNNYNLVTLECDPNIARQLAENKDLNSLNFQIENSALSKRKLIQHGWTTIASDTLLPGYTEVQTIAFNDLHRKYNIAFDTLVLDCEGAFYYILMDMPEILDNINLIIMENDYNDISHKNYIDDIMTKKGFYVDYSEAGGWGCCYNNFYEVWKR